LSPGGDNRRVREERPAWWTQRPPDWVDRLARIAAHLKLTPGERLVLIHIGDRVNQERGYAWPTVAGLCERTGLKRRFVQYARLHLRKLGVIAYDDEDVVPGAGCRCFVRWTVEGAQPVRPPAEPETDGAQCAQEGAHSTTGGRTQRHLRAQPVRPNSQRPPHEDPSGNPTHRGALKRAPAELSPPDFAAFWNDYPRKLKKKAARKAWRRLAPSPELAAKIVAAVERLRGTPDWTRDAGRYIPGPADFLENERWEDECDVRWASSRTAANLAAMEEAARKIMAIGRKAERPEPQCEAAVRNGKGEPLRGWVPTAGFSRGSSG
jgi:hypothetical protein